METAIGRDRATTGQASGKRPRVQKNVTAAIGTDICMGRYTERSPLLYGVSRTVIRESLKILGTKGLVYSRPRVGTVVCSKDDWNLLDPQILEWMGPHVLGDDLLDCILETRRIIEPAAAEFAAERATPQDLADLDRAWRRMRDAGDDVEAFTSADAAFHEIMLKASHNQVFRQLFSIIQAALNHALHTSNEASDKHDEALAVHRELVEALRIRDKAAARACSNRMLDMAAHDISVAMSRMTEA